MRLQPCRFSEKATRLFTAYSLAQAVLACIGTDTIQLLYPVASVGGNPNWSLGVRGLPFSSRKKGYAVGENP